MKTSDWGQALTRVVAEFKRSGILLESDWKLPSVSSLVVGKPVRGSWWGHPNGRAVWRVLGDFCERRDVLATKLVSGKVTFVHRRLWPQILSIGVSQEAWQIDSLSFDARMLLHAVERKGKVRTDTPGLTIGPTAKAAMELERRLLVQSEQVHTERGSHAKILRSWTNWSKKVGLTGKVPNVQQSKIAFESIVGRMNARYFADGGLPWARRSTRALRTK
jgi:hypothetical protein